jgi:hypothetical protein
MAHPAPASNLGRNTFLVLTLRLHDLFNLAYVLVSPFPAKRSEGPNAS